MRRELLVVELHLDDVVGFVEDEDVPALGADREEAVWGLF